MRKILLAFISVAFASNGGQLGHALDNMEAFARFLMLGSSTAGFNPAWGGAPTPAISSTSRALQPTDFGRHVGRHAPVLMGQRSRVQSPDPKKGLVRRDPLDGKAYHKREFEAFYGDDQSLWEAGDVSPLDPIDNERLYFADRNAAALAEYEIDEELAGKVTALTTFGVWLDVGAKEDVTLHVSRMGKDYFGTVADNFKIGDLIECRVASGVYGKELVSISFGVGKPFDEFQLGQEVEGVIRAWPNNQGIVVDIGAQINAYLAGVDMLIAQDEHPMDYFELGDKIRARIIIINTRKPEIVLTCLRTPKRQNWQRLGNLNYK